MNLSEPNDSHRRNFKARGVLIQLPRLVDVTVVALSLHEALVIPGKSCEFAVRQNCVLRIVNADGLQLVEIETQVKWASAMHIGLVFKNVGPGIEHILRALLNGGASAAPVARGADLGALLRASGVRPPGREQGVSC